MTVGTESKEVGGVFDCGITVLFGEMTTQIENGIVTAVQRVGIDVDKERLEEVLFDARGNYERGFREGYEQAALDTPWIPVGERLPEDGSGILAFYDNGTETRVIACNYYKGEWYECIFKTVRTFHTITHWMPLPKPPKKGGGQDA